MGRMGMGMGTVSKTEQLWFELAKIRSTNCVCGWATDWHRRQHSVIAMANKNGTYSLAHMNATWGICAHKKECFVFFLYFNYRTIELPHFWRCRWNFECQQPACVFVCFWLLCCFCCSFKFFGARFSFSIPFHCECVLFSSISWIWAYLPWFNTGPEKRITVKIVSDCCCRLFSKSVRFIYSKVTS